MTHLWTNPAGDTVYLVDASSPVLFNGLQGVLSSFQKVEKVHIFITHYHIDHMQALAAFINRTDALITLTVA